MIGWDIFDFSPRTAERILMKLYSMAENNFVFCVLLNR